MHDLAPYFQKQLQDMLGNCKYLVLGVDESLNKVASKQQMDVVVRYRDDEVNKVQTRYFSFVFLHSTKTIDLKNGLI